MSIAPLRPHELLIFRTDADESISVGRFFTAGEFRPDNKYDGHRGPWFIVPRLVNALDVIRERVGQPLRIVSGYRPPHYNRMIGGASDSRHMYGDAADLSCDMGPLRLARLIWSIYGDSLSLGFSKHRCHVDTRPIPVLYGYDELKGKSDADLIKILEAE